MSPGTIVCRPFCVRLSSTVVCALSMRCVPFERVVSPAAIVFHKTVSAVYALPTTGHESDDLHNKSLSPLWRVLLSLRTAHNHSKAIPLSGHTRLRDTLKAAPHLSSAPTPRCCHTHRNSIRVHSTTTHTQTHTHTHKQRTYTPSPPLPPQSPHTPSRCLVPPLMASMNLPRQSAPSLLTSLPHQETLTLP